MVKYLTRSKYVRRRNAKTCCSDGSKLYPGNCNDNLNEPEFGAVCIESSPTAGDAQCSAIAGPSTTTAPISSTTSSQAAGYSATGRSPFKRYTLKHVNYTNDIVSTKQVAQAHMIQPAPTSVEVLFNPSDDTQSYRYRTYLINLIEAQVPFGLCESTDITGQFASCSKCPTGGASTTTTPISYTTTTPPIYTTPSPSSVSSSSTCSPYSAAACPAVANPCCAYLCGGTF